MPSYPHFQTQAISGPASLDSQTSPCIVAFKNKLKGKGKHNVLVGTSEGIHVLQPTVDKDHQCTWGEHILETPEPADISQIVTADITGDGFNDIIIVECQSDIKLHAGRISWLENPGSQVNASNWPVRQVGCVPGLNCVITGHFTSTFSTQILAFNKSEDPTSSPIMRVYTRPHDYRASHSWLVTKITGLPITGIKGCIAAPARRGDLDSIVISSAEGLSVVWYQEQTWHCELVKSVTGDDEKSLFCPGSDFGKRSLLAQARLEKSVEVTMIVAAENDGKGPLTVFINPSVLVRNYFPAMPCSRYIVDDFITAASAGPSGNKPVVKDVVCADMDGDGVDEILVSVDCEDERKGVYYYDLNEDNNFTKYKILDEFVEKIAPGQFVSDDGKWDLATHSVTASSPLRLYASSLVSSPVTISLPSPSTHSPWHGLIFKIPHPTELCPQYPSEIDVLLVGDFTFSLLILPPNATYQFHSPITPPEPNTESVPSPTAEVSYVKVLDGVLAWIDSRGEVEERRRISIKLGKVKNMWMDASEGIAKSGGEGCVCLRIRMPAKSTPQSAPLRRKRKLSDVEWGGEVGSDSKLSTTAGQKQNLRAKNILPSWFESEVREWSFVWRRATSEPWYRRGFAKGATVHEAFYLPAFTVLYNSPASHDALQTPPSTPIFLAYIHLWASPPGSSTGFRDYTLSPSLSLKEPPAENVCSIQACLSNSSGESGVHIFSEGPPPKLRKILLPAMHEMGPLWNGGEKTGTDVYYPRHAWLAGGKSEGVVREKWDMWMQVDFQPFS